MIYDCDIQVDGKWGPGRPKKSGVKSAVCAASQLPEKGPSDVDDHPIPAF